MAQRRQRVTADREHLPRFSDHTDLKHHATRAKLVREAEALLAVPPQDRERSAEADER